MRTRLTMTLTASVAALALTACGGSGGPASNAPTPLPTGTQPAPVDTNEPSSSAVATPTVGSAPPSAPTTVNKTLTDPAVGNRVTVVKYAVGYQPSAAALARDSGLGDDDIVLVDLSIVASSKFTTTFGSSNFQLQGTSTGSASLPVSGLEKELAAAGFPMLKDASPGSSSRGWLAFATKKNQESYVLIYTRLATRSAGGTNIPAKTFELPLG